MYVLTGHQLTIVKQHIVFWGHTYLPRSRHILLCMCLHVCMYSCCAGDVSLPVVRLVDSFHLVMVNISREYVAYSHRFLRCCMDTCLAFPISMYVCMCSWSDLIFSFVFSTGRWRYSTDKGSTGRAIGPGGEASAGRSKYWVSRQGG